MLTLQKITKQFSKVSHKKEGPNCGDSAQAGKSIGGLFPLFEKKTTVLQEKY